MRCAACSAEFPNDAVKCPACGAAVSKRARRAARPQPIESPFSPNIESPNLGAAWSYRIACLGLVPGLGLVLGFVAVLVGWVSLWRNKLKPEFTAGSLAKFGVLLGLLEAASNWVGLWLMIVYWPWRG